MASEPRPQKASFGIGRLFELVSDAVIVASAATGRVVLWNPSAALMFGIPEPEAIDMPLVRLVPPPLRERHLAGLERYAQGEPSSIIDTRQSVELPALRADGTSLWIELQLSSVPADEGVDTDDRFVIAVIRDITARKAAEADAIARSDQLRAVNEGMRNFLAAAAHDIVGPAGGMRNAAELICQSDELAEAHELAELIQRQAELVIDLGRGIGQMALIESGTVPTDRSAVSVSDIVDTALAATSSLATPDDVVVRVAPQLQWFVDRNHATRIVANLIGNARKYGKPPIRITATPAPGRVELVVSDDGEGVPEDFTAQLFEKFTRAQKAGDGLGLGLAICRGLAQANGGSVTYEPRDGSGAAFVVRLPDRDPSL